MNILKKRTIILRLPVTIIKNIDKKAIHQVMELFWRKGYFNTSIGDIITNTDLNRATLYKYFHDKEGLFCICLDYYLENITPLATQPLLSNPASIDNLITFYKQFLTQAHPFVNNGCLIMATVSDAPLHSEAVQQRIELFSTGLYNAINKQLMAIKNGDKRRKITAMLMGHTFGLISLLRMKHTHTILSDQIHGIISVLKSFQYQEPIT